MALRLSTGFRNKSLGINTEMILNGLFTTDTDPPPSWTASTATLTTEASGQAGNCMQIAESGGAQPGKAYQDVTTIIGRLYRLTLYFKKGTADYGKFMIGTTSSEAAIYDSGNLNDAAWAAKEKYFVATATTTRITLESVDATGGETSFFDTVSMVDFAKCFQEIFYLCFIDIYSGSQPASADNAYSGTLLATIYSDGSAVGLSWDDASAGAIAKKSTETWTGAGLADGTAGWFRIRCAGDTTGASSTKERVDGAIATSGAEMDATSTAVVTAAIQTITSLTITLPAA